MRYPNPLTVRRHQKALAQMVYEIMHNQDVSLLQAYVTLANMASSEEVIAMAKAKVEGK